MKLCIIASSLLIVSAILYSASFITSALFGIIMNGIGDDLYPQTQPLFFLSIIALVVAVVLFLIDYFKK